MSQRFTFDFTSYNVSVGEDEVSAYLRKLASKWAFQLEATQEGRLHYQGRMRLRSKQRLSRLIEILSSGPLGGSHLSITSQKATKDFSYVLKIPSVRGPWTDIDVDRGKKPSDIKFMEEQGLRPWMDKVIGVAREHLSRLSHSRRCLVILDPAGGAGKSHLKRFGGWHGLWFSIPVMNSAKDLVAFALDNEHLVYTVDVPRSMDLRKANEFWTGLERISDADLSDWRYKPRVSQFREKPLLIIFTNKEPPRDMLSADRWDVRTIDHGTWDLVKN